MKTDKYKNKVFEEYKEQIIGINEHFEGCRYTNKPYPINECLCDCYNKQVFNLGLGFRFMRAC